MSEPIRVGGHWTCPKCGETYHSSEIHECGARQRYIEESVRKALASTSSPTPEPFTREEVALLPDGPALNVDGMVGLSIEQYERLRATALAASAPATTPDGCRFCNRDRGAHDGGGMGHYFSRATSSEPTQSRFPKWIGGHEVVETEAAPSERRDALENPVQITEAGVVYFAVKIDFAWDPTTSRWWYVKDQKPVCEVQDEELIANLNWAAEGCPTGERRDEVTDEPPHANPTDASNGWTLDPTWLKRIAEEVETRCAEVVTMEEVEAVVLVSRTLTTGRRDGSDA